MKLISEIINELVDDGKSISSPLLKTKVLASRLQNYELLNWVNLELKGYSVRDKIPEYRICATRLSGSYINNGMQFTNSPIVTNGLDPKFKESFKTIEFHHGVSTLEGMLKEKKTDTLESVLSAEIAHIIGHNIIQQGNPSFQILEIKQIISISSISEIILSVQNKLLDFMLKVDEEFGSLTEIKDLKTKSNEIQTIMNNTIINTNGDGNFINTGDKASINAEINISKGDKENLQKHLEDIGITKEDSQELIDVIDSEEPNRELKTFGKKVNAWTNKMFGKVLDGSWKIGIETASAKIVEAIAMYYGL
jgi:hypothetical protein